MHAANIQLIDPVALAAGGLYCLKVTIDSDSEGRISGMYGLAKAPYTAHCRFGIKVKPGKHTYTATLRPQPDAAGKYGGNRAVRLSVGGFKNANLEFSDVSIVLQ